MTKKLILIIALLLPLPSFAAAPVCLYQDVLSGPASGGERGNGIYLSIFGNNFGSSRGTSTVTVNGTPVAQYLYWGADPTGDRQQIGVQIAKGTTTGGIVVTTPGGSCSNLSFTVRSGHIYFVGPNVDNSTPGSCSTKTNSYAAPWGLTNYASTNESNYNWTLRRTPYTYYNCLSPADTLVFLNGVNYPYYDGYGFHASLTLTNANTTSSSFITLQARPGASVQLGGENWVGSGIRDTVASGYTVMSGITFSATTTGASSNLGAVGLGAGDRLVGSTVTCPNCDGTTAAVYAEYSSNNITVLGNLVYQVSTDTSQLPSGSQKTMHSIYLSGSTQEVAWNRIYNTRAYNGVQFNQDGSTGFYNLSVHDNDIADVNGSGINFSTIDPSSGYVQAYNNIIHHVGVNVASDGNLDNPHGCVAVKGYYGSPNPGTVNIYNNTMFDCTSYLNTNAGGGGYCAVYIAPNTWNSVTTNLVNNVVYQPAYTHTGSVNVYMCPVSDGRVTARFSGSKNIWYSASTPGSTAYATTIGTIENPLFVSAANGLWTNYELQSTSPAIGAGIRVGAVQSQGVSNPNLTWDFQQITRPSAPSIGALE